MLSHIHKLITDEHNNILGKSIKLMEVEIFVKQMEKDKAPGPDGFTTNFFHACWDWLKEEIWALVEDSRKIGNILRALNSTLLTLTPKKMVQRILGNLYQLLYVMSSTKSYQML